MLRKVSFSRAELVRISTSLFRTASRSRTMEVDFASSPAARGEYSEDRRTSRVELATNDGLTVSTKIRARPSIAIMDKRMHRQFLNMPARNMRIANPSGLRSI